MMGGRSGSETQYHRSFQQRKGDEGKDRKREFRDEMEEHHLDDEDEEIMEEDEEGMAGDHFMDGEGFVVPKNFRQVKREQVAWPVIVSILVPFLAQLSLT